VSDDIHYIIRINYSLCTMYTNLYIKVTVKNDAYLYTVQLYAIRSSYFQLC